MDFKHGKWMDVDFYFSFKFSFNFISTFKTINKNTFFSVNNLFSMVYNIFSIVKYKAKKNRKRRIDYILEKWMSNIVFFVFWRGEGNYGWCPFFKILFKFISFSKNVLQNDWYI